MKTLKLKDSDTLRSIDGYVGRVYKSIAATIEEWQTRQKRRMIADDYQKALQERDQQINFGKEKEPTSRSYWVGEWVPLPRHRGDAGRTDVFFVKEQDNIPPNPLIIEKVELFSREVERFLKSYRALHPRRIVPDIQANLFERNSDIKGKDIKGKDLLTLAAEAGPPNTTLLAVSGKFDEDVISIGDVICCSDRDGHHFAILMQLGEDTSKVLFLTSNPDWNKRARRLTKEERNLLGFPDRGKETYLAPTIYPTRHLYRTDKVYPHHRFQELMEEFNEG